MKIYIAGKWEEHPLIEKYAQQLEAAGHKITFPWFRKHVGGTYTGGDPAELTAQALQDIEGVQEADTCIFIFERVLPYAGAFVELGIAIGRNIPCIIVGSGGDKCLFVHHARLIRVNNFNDVWDWIPNSREEASATK